MIYPAIDGKRGDAFETMLTREVAANDAGIMAKTDNKPNVLMMFFIPFLHLLCIYFIIQTKIKKAKNELFQAENLFVIKYIFQFHHIVGK